MRGRKSLGNKKATALLLIFNGPLGEGKRGVFSCGNRLALGKLIKEAYCRWPVFHLLVAGPHSSWLLLTSVHQRAARKGRTIAGQSHHTPCAVEPSQGAVCKMKFPQQFRIGNNGIRKFQTDTVKIFLYVHWLTSSMISITVSSCSRVTWGVGLPSRIHSAKCFSSL